MFNFRCRAATICIASLASLVSGCAATPTKNTAAAPSAPNAAAAALYARLDTDEKKYFAARDPATYNKDTTAATAQYKAAWDDALDAQATCAKTRGCDGARFDAAFARMTGAASAPAEADNNGAPMTPEATSNAGENSPVATALPEVGRSITLLKGKELSEVMTLNGPVKVALEEWLTSLRPYLLDTYENYMYLRHLMWPEYQKAGLPEAILFGIMAKESGGRVHAVSRSGAAGLLQFMPATGARFGLGYVDGFDQRYDPALAARANAAYLNEQLAIFNNNLELVIAAYNGGEGRVQRLARGAPDASFWDPKIFYELAPETRDYVPVVLAAAWLFLHPEKYNLTFPKIDGRPGVLILQKNASLTEVAVCLGQDGNMHDGWFRTLRNLNPAIDPRETLPASTRLHVPQPVVAAYERNCVDGVWAAVANDLHQAVLTAPPPPPTISRNGRAPPPPPHATAHGKAGATYVLRRGETLAGVARKFGCHSAADLAKANGIKPTEYSSIRPGRVLQVGVCTQ
jgi:membrane-bound lytic murein transglycosylase D